MPSKSKNTIDTTKTLVIDNFTGNLTRFINGDLNSGNAKYSTTFGVDNYFQPKNLTFMEQATNITGSVVTDCIMQMKPRNENGIMYVYAIGHTGRFYKIQVNNPSAPTPIYDNVVLLGTLSQTFNSNLPTFNYGASIEFYAPAGTEYVYIAHDLGVTQINFDASGESALYTWASGTNPHPSRQFLGKVFYGNGSNIAVLDTSSTVSSGAVLSPGFPTQYQIRDLDLTEDGVYLVMTGTYSTMFPILSTTPDSSSTINEPSSIYYWDGTTTAYTSSTSIPSFVLTAYHTFANFEYSFGYDLTGAIMMNPLQKTLTNIFAKAPLPNAVSSNGNIIGWMAPEFVNGFMQATLFLYGQLDAENPIIFTRQYRQAATVSNSDVINIPAMCVVSNFQLVGATQGYSSFNGLFSLGKSYFSTVESNGSTTNYYLYSFSNVPIGLNSAVAGVYETQTQMFSKKIKPTQIRVYTEPIVTNNSFKIDLIGSSNNPITNGSYTFTAGSTATVGLDMLQYNPTMGGTYGLGIRVTNLGSVNLVIHKIEVDYNQFGQ